MEAEEGPLMTEKASSPSGEEAFSLSSSGALYDFIV